MITGRTDERTDQNNAETRRTVDAVDGRHGCAHVVPVCTAVSALSWTVSGRRLACAACVTRDPAPDAWCLSSSSSSSSLAACKDGGSGGGGGGDGVGSRETAAADWTCHRATVCLRAARNARLARQTNSDLYSEKETRTSVDVANDLPDLHTRFCCDGLGWDFGSTLKKKYVYTSKQKAFM